MLGAGTILAVLLVWELSPYFVSLSGRHQDVLHDAEPDRRDALDHDGHRHALGAARRQRRGLHHRPLAAIAVGIPLGVLLGRSRTLNAMFDPFITAFNATPRLVFCRC